MRSSLKPLLPILILTAGVATAGWPAAQKTPSAPPTKGQTAPAAPRTLPKLQFDSGNESMHSFRHTRGGNRDDGSAKYSMNFERADADSVVQFLSMISRVPIVTDPTLTGDMTIISPKRVSLKEVYDIINAALRVHGFAMVGDLNSSVIQVVPLKKAIAAGTSVVAGSSLGNAVTDIDMVTQVVPIQYASSDDLCTQLKPLISSDQASLVSLASTNTLIITDSGSNVKRLMDIIKSVDKDTLGTVAIQVYQCQYASADSLASTLSSLFQSNSSTGNTRLPSSVSRVGNQGSAATRTPRAAPSSTDTLVSLRDEINISSDSRTNRLVISGTRDRIAMVLDVIKDLDVDTEPEVKAKFFPLKYADASTVADLLNNLFEQPQGSASTGSSNRGFFPFGRQTSQTSTSSTSYAGLKRNVVVADVRTNSVIVTATEQNMKAFVSIIQVLDAPKVLSETTRVYPLKYAKADTLAQTLTQLFRGNYNSTTSGGRYVGGVRSIFGLGNSSSQDSDSPLAQLQNITVVAETKTNSLLVTGPPNCTSVMDDLVAQLDKRTAEVFIEVAIVDVTLDNEDQFGVEWQWHDANSSASTNFGESTDSTGLKYSVLHNNVQALLRALQTRNDVKVLSTPTITTADNVQAKISIGQDIPYVSNSTMTSGGNQQNTVDFRTVAISLTVTPHVNGASDVIALDVHQVINEILGTDTSLNAPIIADREAQTSISVSDGQTIVIGGIIQDNKSKYTKAVPILSSIPLLGNLFKSQDYKASRSELMVFLTPRILKTDQDVKDVSDSARQTVSSSPLSALKKTESTDSPKKPM